MRNRATTPLLARAVLLSGGAIASFGVMVWAAGQAAPSSVNAGPQAAIADSNDVGESDESGNGETDDPTVLDDDGRFTGPGEVWPPQPKDATDIVERSDSDLTVLAEDASLQRLDGAADEGRSASEVLAADAAVTDALGQRYNLIAVEEQAVEEQGVEEQGVEEQAAEGQLNGSTRLVYYSLSNNQTVDVTVTPDSVSDLALIAPDQYQPELAQAEKQAAVEVARSHWEDRRDRRIDSLQGFSILAFQPGGSYYDTRMVYVSFHVDEDSRPELLAWVDLVTGEVVQSEVDR